jgi:hypothetical protein
MVRDLLMEINIWIKIVDILKSILLDVLDYGNTFPPGDKLENIPMKE